MEQKEGRESKEKSYWQRAGLDCSGFHLLGSQCRLEKRLDELKAKAN